VDLQRRTITLISTRTKQAATFFERSREAFAHDSHNEEETEIAPEQTLSPEVVDLVGPEEVTLTVASWNQLTSWLRQVERLRNAAWFESPRGSL
jgi:hypothetical protein